MKISHEKPPNWDVLVARFGATWGKTVVTYGDTCHCARPLSNDLAVHEAVHVGQQLSYGVEAWWQRYMVDPDFRVHQETEAYRAQFLYINRTIKDRNLRFKERDRLARDLSSNLYGKSIGYLEAYKKIG